MILEKLCNVDYYSNLHPMFTRVFDFTKSFLEKPVEPGVYELEGEDLFVKVQDYITREEGYFEVHNQYIDVQCMIEGVEKVFVTSREGLAPACDYDKIEDALFLKDREECVEFLFKAGEVAIFFPWDAHKPAMCVGQQARAKKLVFKVKI